MGLLRWTRLPSGIKTASALFQAAIEKTVFEGDCISNIVVYQDDICIGAVNEGELNEKVSCVLKKPKDAEVTVNESKCVFKTEAVDFLGYNISVNGVKHDVKLVKKVELIKVPSSKKELSCFVGLVNFFGRYINNFAEIVGPLNDLRKKECSFRMGQGTTNGF